MTLHFRGTWCAFVVDRERAYSAAVSTIVRGPRSVWLLALQYSYGGVVCLWARVGVGLPVAWGVYVRPVFFFLCVVWALALWAFVFCVGGLTLGEGRYWCCAWFGVYFVICFPSEYWLRQYFSHWNDTPGGCPLPPRPRYTPCWVAPLTLLLPPTFHGRGCSMGVRPLPLLGGHPRPRPPCPRALTRLACCFRSFVAAAILAPAGAPHSRAPPSQPAHTSVGGRPRPRVVCFCSAVAATVAAVVLLLVLGFL